MYMMIRQDLGQLDSIKDLASRMGYYNSRRYFWWPGESKYSTNEQDRQQTQQQGDDTKDTGHQSIFHEELSTSRTLYGVSEWI